MAVPNLSNLVFKLCILLIAAKSQASQYDGRDGTENDRQTYSRTHTDVFVNRQTVEVCTNPKRCITRKGRPRACCSNFLCDITGRRRCVMPSYYPGNLTVFADGDKLLLSTGLKASIVATAGQPVPLKGGKFSSRKFHLRPDAAACFAKDGGGWIYASNSEVHNNKGGAGAIEFNAKGRVVGYQRILEGTSMNCGGGSTPWGSWISCEEVDAGQIYQCDPNGQKDAGQTVLGGEDGGKFESFAADNRTSPPTFYVTEDNADGALRRFTPDEQGMACYNETSPADRWCTLQHGTLDYLVLSGGGDGTFKWTTNLTEAKASANAYYRNAEGIDIKNGTLYFVSKVFMRLLILDLDERTYSYTTTVSGAFNYNPDQVGRIVGDDDDILYFCEDGGTKVDCGVHGRNRRGDFFTILEGPGLKSETTGLAFSPNGFHLYVSFQDLGIVYDVTREDGLPFDATLLDIKYHATATD